MSDTTTITPEERAYWRRIIDEDDLIGDNAKIWRLLNALEQAEARVKSRNNHIHRLLGEALENERNLDGMKSRWQAAEADNARLTKERDWLANKLDCPSEFTNCAVDCAECRKEAARRAVAAGEEPCQK